LEQRLEYLTLAVGNAKSHPVAAGGQHEAAIAFLTDLEEKLEVAQVQLELYHILLPKASDPGEDGAKARLLGKRLFNITEVCALKTMLGLWGINSVCSCISCSQSRSIYLL
jgi:nuclear pore complex protein Nup155